MGSRQLLASWLRGDCEAVLPEVRTYVGTLARALPVCVADLLARTVLEIIRRTSTVDQYQREGKRPGEPHPHDAARSPSLQQRTATLVSETASLPASLDAQSAETRHNKTTRMN